MKVNTSINIYKYLVDVKSTRKNTGSSSSSTVPGGKRVAMVAYGLLFNLPEFQLLGPGVATDYSRTILTVKKLVLDPDGKKTYTIQYREAEDTVPRPNAITYSFTVSFEKIIPTAELTRYLASAPTDPSDFNTRNDAVAAMNIVIAKTPNSNPDVFQAGTNKFFNYPQSLNDYANLDLGDGLIAVRGYYTSVRTSTSRTLLNVNAQCSPFYPARVNMVVLMEKHPDYKKAQWKQLERFIEKLRVKTKYLKTKDGTVDVRVKTVVGLSHQYQTTMDPTTRKQKRIGNATGDHGDASQITFKCDDFPEHNEVSVEEYFRKSKLHYTPCKFDAITKLQSIRLSLSDQMLGY